MEVPHKRKSRWTLNLSPSGQGLERNDGTSRPVKTDLGSIISPRYEGPPGHHATARTAGSPDSESDNAALAKSLGLNPRSRSSTLRRSLTVVTKGLISDNKSTEKSTEKPAEPVPVSERETPRNPLGARRATTIKGGPTDFSAQPKPPRDELDTRFEQMMV